MLEVRRRAVEETTVETSHGSYKLTSRETTIHLGGRLSGAFWTYRRPAQVEDVGGHQLLRIHDYGMTARLAAIAVMLLGVAIARTAR